MTDQMLHTPDGVRDIYNGECKQKLLLQDRLHDVLKRYGYRDIQTPTFEFFNIFSKEVGTTPSRDLYKFFDKEGNTLVLRPDFTPSIARSAAKYYTEEDMPVKLSYMGNTFINSSSYQGRLKETTQCGAELIGDGSVAADAEILAMVVDCLTGSGLKEFQISVGHARFFQGIVEAAGLGEEQEDQLRSLLSNKNFLGVEEFAEQLDLSDELKELMLMLGSFETAAEELSDAEKLAAAYPRILSAIRELEELGSYLKLYGIEKYISFELGIISSYHYYTGIIFAGYTFGTGEPVVRGGRYDRLLTYFGKNSPSIGFAIVVDQLMAALSRQKIFLTVPEESILLIYRKEKIEPAIRKAQKLRQQGKIVTLIPVLEGQQKEYYINYAMKNHIAKVDFMDEQA
ncbi:MAG: ATP phosphoribosyltransferase regulatory subunit [Agathobacter sp.]